jgi:hypothetical protein
MKIHSSLKLEKGGELLPILKKIIMPTGDELILTEWEQISRFTLKIKNQPVPPLVPLGESTVGPSLSPGETA